METYTKKAPINHRIKTLKSGNKTIGFVPTMGALHEGHLSLVRQCIQENAITVVSIFVNPTQFDNPADLDNYPRMEERDKEILEKEGVDIVFNPSSQEMYPEKDTRKFDFGHLDKVMEGKYRKGHFNGVAQIVSKLFSTIEPHRAYFGKKDYQQLVIIKELVKQRNYDIDIVAGPIIREKDGLAISSRNLHLTKEQRNHAPLIAQTLKACVKMPPDYSVDQIKKWVSDTINTDPYLELEYFEIVNAHTLEKIQSWEQSDEIIGCIAAYAGKIRLIDNIHF